MHLIHRKTCRVCGSPALTPVISLGEQYLQGSFVLPGKEEPPLRKIPLTLVRCDPTRDENSCGLLQMKHSVPPEILYSAYWYRSGTNKTMRDLTSSADRHDLVTTNEYGLIGVDALTVHRNDIDVHKGNRGSRQTHRSLLPRRHVGHAENEQPPDDDSFSRLHQRVPRRHGLCHDAVRPSHCLCNAPIPRRYSIYRRDAKVCEVACTVVARPQSNQTPVGHSEPADLKGQFLTFVNFCVITDEQDLIGAKTFL